MAHKLGAAFHLPHGLANALLIANVIRYNANDNPAKQAAFSQYDRPKAKCRYAEIAEHLGMAGRDTDGSVGEPARVDRISEARPGGSGLDSGGRGSGKRVPGPGRLHRRRGLRRSMHRRQSALPSDRRAARAADRELLRPAFPRTWWPRVALPRSGGGCGGLPGERRLVHPVTGVAASSPLFACGGPALRVTRSRHA